MLLFIPSSLFLLKILGVFGFYLPVLLLISFSTLAIIFFFKFSEASFVFLNVPSSVHSILVLWVPAS